LSRAAGDADGLKRALWEEGWALYKLRRWPESIQASEMALEIDEKLATVRFNLGLALLRNRDLARALAEYRKAMELGDAGALNAAGIHDLECALRDEPNLPGGREILAELRRAYRSTALSSLETRTRARSAGAGAAGG
jgi:tetratricopeptide (TPR) repeat protein